MFVRLLPASATSASARISTGNDWTTSAMRSTSSPTSPRVKLAATPKTTPMRRPRPTPAAAIERSIRGANIARVKMSNPVESVPNGWLNDGPCRASMTFGSSTP